MKQELYTMETPKSCALALERQTERQSHVPTSKTRYRWFRRGTACITIIALARWFYTGNWTSESITGHCLDRTKGFKDATNGEPALTEPWSKIIPSRDLVFSDCFDGHQCARLSVPMDWNSTQPDTARVHLAITKIPAKVPVTDPRYGGLLWLQTGGPGSSAVNFILRHGKTAQMIIDSPIDPSHNNYDKLDPPKYFDVIGVDPRGINNTTPRLVCFPDTVTKDVWALQAGAEGVLGSSNQALANLWTRTTALSAGCTRRMMESEDPNDQLGFHMNTSPVIADIVEVIEKYGKWREEEATKLLASQVPHKYRPRSKEGSDSSISREELEAIIERTKWKQGEEKLMFWGLSYGTIIGATFAAMQPHRIERAIIDSVADTSDYYSGQWRTNLQDTDSLLDKFSQYCYEAGPKACALHVVGGPSSIKHRFTKIIKDIKSHPIGVVSQKHLAPDMITYSDVKSLISEAVYAPIQMWPTVAELLSDLERRNGTAFAAAKQSSSLIKPPMEACRHATPYSQECAIPDNKAGEISTAILCTDGNGTYGMTEEAFAAYAAELREQSWLIGDSWAQIRLGCVAWGIRPKWRFGGPFAGEIAKGMLIVGTLTDPVTPIRNAHAMAKRYPGSVVLPVAAEGHCIMSSPSLCMARHLRVYFQTGELPVPGTVCDSNEKPFLGLIKDGKPEEESLLKQLRWSAANLF